ncbi:nitroreductase family protein [Mobiluncus mulieris]|nr:nitroreductase family protein [Mobiluncus mulieris]
MNETVETLLSHRTIRKFENKPVPEDLMHTLFEVAMRTATSRATQNASIIRVKD